MTLTYAEISYISPFVVSDSAGSTFTISEFNYHFNNAKERLDADDPGLSSKSYDMAHALLICHLHSVKLGQANKSSESLGSYSYSRGGSGIGSSYLDEYNALIRSCGRSKGPTNANDYMRSDKDMNDFDLDQRNIPSYTMEDI